MNTLLRTYSLMAMAALLVFLPHAHGTGTGANPHVINGADNGSPACTACHQDTPTVRDDTPFSSKNLPVEAGKFRADGVAMCANCHDPGRGHKVGLGIDFPVPADLPLKDDQDISCLTCHYSHGRLDSDRPQASFSFLDRLTNSERLHKSFLLRRNNSDGELCLTCHNVNQESKS